MGTVRRIMANPPYLRIHKDYCRLQALCGAHPPQQVLKQVDRNFKSFFQALKQWKKTPSVFTGRPQLPSYKPKNGQNVVYFTALQCRTVGGAVILTQKMMNQGFRPIKTALLNVKGVRIVPFGDRFNIELIYDAYPQGLHLDPAHALGIDLGLTNIVTASDTRGSVPLIIKGGVVKATNQFYNKQLAKYKSFAKQCNDAHTTARITRLHRKRNNKIRDFFHKTSRLVINNCIANDLGTIVIGYNEGWKQNATLGKRNNQNFVTVPFLKLIQQIEYKAAMVGIAVIRVNEAYTSQTCSWCGVIAKGNRKHRGLYVCRDCGEVLNADVNASKNILYKGIPKSFGIGDRGCLTRPIVLKI